MSKPFITYTAQVEKLKNEKNLVITDDDFAVESLQNISYYALIGGYKHPFIDIHTRKYINEACFEDIVVLYEFDEELRGIFFKYLCRVERKMRSSISYHFCKKHGERQEEYLNSNNYGNIPKNKNGITKLIKMLDMMANKNKDHEYLVYQRNKYHNIPLWVIMNTPVSYTHLTTIIASLNVNASSNARISSPNFLCSFSKRYTRVFLCT